MWGVAGRPFSRTSFEFALGKLNPGSVPAPPPLSGPIDKIWPDLVMCGHNLCCLWTAGPGVRPRSSRTRRDAGGVPRGARRPAATALSPPEIASLRTCPAPIPHDAHAEHGTCVCFAAAVAPAHYRGAAPTAICTGRAPGEDGRDAFSPPPGLSLRFRTSVAHFGCRHGARRAGLPSRRAAP